MIKNVKQTYFRLGVIIMKWNKVIFATLFVATTMSSDMHGIGAARVLCSPFFERLTQQTVAPVFVKAKLALASLAAGMSIPTGLVFADKLHIPKAEDIGATIEKKAKEILNPQESTMWDKIPIDICGKDLSVSPKAWWKEAGGTALCQGMQERPKLAATITLSIMYLLYKRYHAARLARRVDNVRNQTAHNIQADTEMRTAATGLTWWWV